MSDDESILVGQEVDSLLVGDSNPSASTTEFAFAGKHAGIDIAILSRINYAFMRSQLATLTWQTTPPSALLVTNDYTFMDYDVDGSMVWQPVDILFGQVTGLEDKPLVFIEDTNGSYLQE